MFICIYRFLAWQYSYRTNADTTEPHRCNCSVCVVIYILICNRVIKDDDLEILRRDEKWQKKKRHADPLIEKRNSTPTGYICPAALGNLYHCASGMGIRGKIFHSLAEITGKALGLSPDYILKIMQKHGTGQVAGFFRKLSDLFSNFLHNTDSGVHLQYIVQI